MFNLAWKHTLKFWKPKRGGRTNILNLLETAQQASSTAGYPRYASISCKHTACTLNMTINLITNLMKIVIHIFQVSLLLHLNQSKNNIFRIFRPSHCCKPPPWPAWQTDIPRDNWKTNLKKLNIAHFNVRQEIV